MKLMIVSNNNLSRDFWNAHLEPCETFLWKSQNGSKLIERLKDLTPDIIIIDDYFRLSENEGWMSKLIELIRALGIGKSVYCLSPCFAFETTNNQNQKFERHSFSRQFLNSVNRRLIAAKKITNTNRL